MTPAFLFTLHNFHLGAEPRTLEMTPILRSHDFRPKSSSAPRRRAEPADWITQEADSQEVSSCGFWPGSRPIPYAAFIPMPIRNLHSFLKRL